ncbi:MAG: metal-dependent hydrolase [Leptospira sp.]|nr:metal-dependent hydrolase [Leptospira sp.]
MFVGHYSISFALKKTDKKISLGMLFLAVQFVDILWAIFILLGVEKVRITPGFTESNALDLYYMPYTHSLPAVILWSVLVGGIFYWYHSADKEVAIRIAVAMGLAVFSHFIIDLFVHKQDLPLLGNTFKVGFGLWDYRWYAFVTETGFLFGGFWLYLQATTGSGISGKYSMWIYIIFLQIVNTINFFFNPPPDNPEMAAISALVAYLALAAVAFWLDKKRDYLET